MYKSIQTCRGIAALQVLLFHLGGLVAAPKYFGVPEFARAFIFGDSGVEFFFVLSGFIITWVHRPDFGHPSALPVYAAKRLIRIYPTYWIVFLGVFLLASLSQATRSELPWSPGVMFRSLLLAPQDPRVVGGTGAPVLVVAWSLQYEMVFYVAIAAAIVHRALAWVLVALALGNYAVCIHGCGFPQSFFSSNLLMLFALGALVAWLSDGRLALKRPVMLAIVATIAYLTLICIDILTEKSGYSIDRSLAYGFIFAVLILALVQSENRGSILGRSRPYQILGNASYALYLIHFPLLSALTKGAIAIGLKGAGGALIAFIVMFGITVAISIAFHVEIEQRILRYLSALVPRREKHLLSR